MQRTFWIAAYNGFLGLFFACFFLFSGAFLGAQIEEARKGVLRDGVHAVAQGGSFALPDGRRYVASDGPLVYERDDPMVRGGSYVAGIEALATSGMLLGVLVFGRFRRGAAAGLVALWACGIGLGQTAYPKGEAVYTLQVGDKVSAGRLLRSFGSPTIQVSRAGLFVDGKPWGNVKNHTHVWVRPNGVWLNGVKAVR